MSLARFKKVLNSGTHPFERVLQFTKRQDKRIAQIELETGQSFQRWVEECINRYFQP